jgi:hypothetical protein
LPATNAVNKAAVASCKNEINTCMSVADANTNYSSADAWVAAHVGGGNECGYGIILTPGIPFPLPYEMINSASIYNSFIPIYSSDSFFEGNHLTGVKLELVGDACLCPASNFTLDYGEWGEGTYYFKNITYTNLGDSYNIEEIKSENPNVRFDQTIAACLMKAP